ncbi:hypothetical protein [Microbacterium sp. Yaish 1]|uniref:hypothetical protein n=1 Tax=Microbacterium sp. Yaish 1 TaxID=2025014 RepID=UPI00117D029D|nr:hypothetical protein [Microbacterium sp. Yaish 1]
MTLAAMLGTGMMMSACAAQLPTWDDIRAETNATMQEVVDLLPPEVVVDDLTNSRPYGCERGVMYTGHLDIDPGPHFDIPAFIESLDDTLPEGFEPRTSQVRVSFARALFTAEPYGSTLLKVTENTAGGRNTIDVLAISRCGEPPQGD